MAYSLLKVYKNGGFLITSNADVFKRPESRASFFFSDIVQSREARVRASRFLDKLSIDKENAMYTYIKAVEKNKRVAFSNFIGDVPSQKQKFDISKTSAESVRKARRRLTDIAFCNDFNYFVTLTLDPHFCNRFSDIEVVQYLQKFCKNYFRRNSGYYLFVPEKHKNGAYHFHGLILSNNRDNNIQRARDPNTGDLLSNSRGVPLYNLVSWQGHNSLVPLDSSSLFESVKYILKYITKDSRCLPRFYYSGGSLVRRPALVYLEGDENEFDRILDAGGFQFSSNDDCPFKFCGLWLDDIRDPLLDLELE